MTTVAGYTSTAWTESQCMGGHAAFEGFYRLWTHYDASDLKNSSNLDSTPEDVHMSNFYPKVDKILSPLHSSQENKELEADTTSTPKKKLLRGQSTSRHFISQAYKLPSLEVHLYDPTPSHLGSTASHCECTYCINNIAGM